MTDKKKRYEIVLQLYIYPQLLQFRVQMARLDQIHLFLQFPEGTEHMYHICGKDTDSEGEVDRDVLVFLLCVFDQPLELLDPLCC